MSIIKIGPFETTSLMTTTTATGDSLDKDDLQLTSISALSSSLATSMIGEKNVQVNYTAKYLDSLTDTQLAEMVERLSEKSDDFTNVIININEDNSDENVKSSHR